MINRIALDPDQHITEPPDFWTNRMPHKYRDRAPKVVPHPEGGQGWSFDDELIRPFGLQSTAGKGPLQMGWLTTYEDIHASCFDAKARLDAMDIDGVDAAMVHPSVALTVSGIHDDGLYVEVFRCYNDAIWDWCQEGDPKRLYPVGIVPALGFETAMNEVARLAKKGFRAIMFNTWPSGAEYPTAEDDPFWALVQEAGMVISVHGGGTGRMPSGPAKKKEVTLVKGLSQELIADGRASGLWVQPALGMFVLSGILQRFPTLKIAAVETGAGWVPYFQEQLDRAYIRQRWAWDWELEALPSEYLKRQLKMTIQFDAIAVKYRKLLGVDRIMVSTDFPHVTTDWPNTRQFLHYIFQNVPDDDLEKIMRTNALEFYGVG